MALSRLPSGSKREEDKAIVISPKQRFPPAVVRLDYEQLQFHHIRGRSPRHTNDSYTPEDCVRLSAKTLLLLPLINSSFSSAWRERFRRVIRIAISCARPNYYIARNPYYRSIGTKRTELRQSSPFCSPSYPPSFRSREMDLEPMG